MFTSLLALLFASKVSSDTAEVPTVGIPQAGVAQNNSGVVASQANIPIITTTVVAQLPSPQPKPSPSPLPPPPPPTGFRYGGGTVLRQMVVQPIYWGQKGTSIEMIQEPLDLLYSEVVQSSYVQLAEYGIKSVTFTPSSFVITNSQPGYDDVLDVQALLRGLVEQGTIKPTTNSYYPVYLSTGSITYGNLNSCTDFCYYRNTIDIEDIAPSAHMLNYAVFPVFTGTCPACASISVIGNLFTNSAMALVSAATNPSATNPKVSGSGGLAPGYTDVQTGVSVGEYCSTVQQISKLEDVVTPAQRHFQLPPLWSQQLKACTVNFKTAVQPVGVVIGSQ
ncbi:hypothetical protein BCR33DRAFT_762229 [Rhizoclosmatium globosum]|uniref:Glycoside hydrolase n=1 Tax=Rhizoclosmatium globosum TaxID=329046 RepID=A0A1Y2CX98_9FUNG|nr:hypothetical protein BCR33DRAFT_762229 [Rhizoclosmatium globosum]|eukprot:ORY51516.1 hypothetical protein BCR33DRAFT_762229 [Rhizoclosmatium globosum]